MSAPRYLLVRIDSGLVHNEDVREAAIEALHSPAGFGTATPLDAVDVTAVVNLRGELTRKSLAGRWIKAVEALS
jgi:hypothetical protein